MNDNIVAFSTLSKINQLMKNQKMFFFLSIFYAWEFHVQPFCFRGCISKIWQFPQRYKTCLASNGLHSPDDMTFVIRNIHTIRSYCLISFRNLRRYVFSSAFVNQHYNSEFNEHLFLFHKNKTRLKSRIIYKPLFGCSNKQKPQKSSLLKCLDVFANRIKWMILRNLRKEKIHSIHCMSSKYNEFTILFNS